MYHTSPQAHFVTNYYNSTCSLPVVLPECGKPNVNELALQGVCMPVKTGEVDPAISCGRERKGCNVTRACGKKRGNLKYGGRMCLNWL